MVAHRGDGAASGTGAAGQEPLRKRLYCGRAYCHWLLAGLIFVGFGLASGVTWYVYQPSIWPGGGVSAASALDTAKLLEILFDDCEAILVGLVVVVGGIVVPHTYRRAPRRRGRTIAKGPGCGRPSSMDISYFCKMGSRRLPTSVGFAKRVSCPGPRLTARAGARPRLSRLQRHAPPEVRSFALSRAACAGVIRRIPIRDAGRGLR